MTRHHSCRVSPFGHPRIHARLTAPRGISQPPTSFIGSQCQGIHHAPLNTYKHKTNSKKKLHIKYDQDTTTHPRKGRQPTLARSMLATTIHKSNTTPHHQSRATTRPQTRRPGHHHPERQRHGLVVSKPNSVSGSHRRPTRPNGTVCCAPSRRHYSNRLLTAPPPPNGTAFSWCSLERR